MSGLAAEARRQLPDALLPAGDVDRQRRRRPEIARGLLAREVVGRIVVRDLQRALRPDLDQALGRVVVAAVGLAPRHGAQRRRVVGQRQRHGMTARHRREVEVVRADRVRRIQLVAAHAHVGVQDARVARRRLHQRAVAGRDGDVAAIVDLVGDVIRRRLPLAAQLAHAAPQFLLQHRQPRAACSRRRPTSDPRARRAAAAAGMPGGASGDGVFVGCAVAAQPAPITTNVNARKRTSEETRTGTGRVLA